ncbi:hypothetical protein NMY22_g5270 [Coprinellus aureogranulatus]|nr:hypothetical protein NMY22_g5270 [Coprinellus aureogranulatus]
MPSQRNPRSARQTLFTRQRAKQVLSHAEKLHADGESSQALEFLAHNLEGEHLRELLDNFAAPISDCGSEHGYAFRHQTMFSVGSPSPEAMAFINRCLEMLLERWSEITRWIIFLIQDSPQSSLTAEPVMTRCLGIVQQTIMAADDNTYKAQIVASPCTIDVVIQFLCLKNPLTGRPLRVPRRRSEPCFISGLLSTTVTGSDAGYSSMALRLASLDRQTTTDLVKCILERIQSLSPSGIANVATVPTAFSDLPILLTILRVLPHSQAKRQFAQCSILSEAARVVGCLANEAIQRREKAQKGKYISLVGSSTEHCDSFRLLQTTIRKDRPLHRDNLPLENSARDLLYWLTDSKVFQAAKKGGLCMDLFNELRAIPRSPAVKVFHDAYASALQCCERIFESRKAITVRLCCNVKHQSPIQEHEDPTGFKREDWQLFHSKECSEASHSRMELRQAGFTERYRRDKTVFLVGLANLYFPDMTTLRREDRLGRHPGLMNRPDIDPPLISFDLTGTALLMKNQFTSYAHETLATFFKRCTFNSHDQERILHCAREMKRSPDTTLLVTGNFLDLQIHTSVCVQMQYSASSAPGKRYKAVSSVSNVGIRSKRGPPKGESEIEGLKLTAQVFQALMRALE